MLPRLRTIRIVGNPAGVTFSGPWTLNSSALQLGTGGIGNLVTISGDISGNNTVDQIRYVGTLVLSAANDFSGTLRRHQRHAPIDGSGSINNASTLSIGTNASGSGTFDVSQLASPYVLSSSTTLVANGDGDGNGGAPATIIGASGGTFDLGTLAD